MRQKKCSVENGRCYCFQKKKTKNNKNKDGFLEKSHKSSHKHKNTKSATAEWIFLAEIEKVEHSFNGTFFTIGEKKLQSETRALLMETGTRTNMRSTVGAGFSWHWKLSDFGKIVTGLGQLKKMRFTSSLSKNERESERNECDARIHSVK